MLEQYGFYRGINLGGWFSQCDYSDERLDTFITEPDFKQIAEWGMDHIRIPADYNVVENEDGTWNDKGFERLEKAWFRHRGRRARYKGSLAYIDKENWRRNPSCRQLHRT